MCCELNNTSPPAATADKQQQQRTAATANNKANPPAKSAAPHPALLTRMLSGPGRFAIAAANFLTESCDIRSRLGPTSTLEPGCAAMICAAIFWPASTLRTPRMTSAPWAVCFWIVCCCLVVALVGWFVWVGGGRGNGNGEKTETRNQRYIYSTPRTRQVVGRLKADAARRARHERDLAREVGGHCLFAAACAFTKTAPCGWRCCCCCCCFACGGRERSPCGATKVKDTCRMNALCLFVERALNDGGDSSALC